MPAMLVLEYCEHGTLLDHVKEGSTHDLDTSMLLTYCHDVASGEPRHSPFTAFPHSDPRLTRLPHSRDALPLVPQDRSSGYRGTQRVVGRCLYVQRLVFTCSEWQ
jgi:hypothetical protein